MIAQNDTRANPNVAAYGCYYFAILFHAWWKENLPLSIEMIDVSLYQKLQKREWMTETCFIKNPVAIFNYLGVDVKHVRKEPASYRPREDEIAIGQWKANGDISHFVAMWNDGQVAFDSWHSKEGGSRAVRDGELISWRIFEL